MLRSTGAFMASDWGEHTVGAEREPIYRWSGDTAPSGAPDRRFFASSQREQSSNLFWNQFLFANKQTFVARLEGAWLPLPLGSASVKQLKLKLHFLQSVVDCCGFAVQQLVKKWRLGFTVVRVGGCRTSLCLWRSKYCFAMPVSSSRIQFRTRRL